VGADGRESAAAVRGGRGRSRVLRRAGGAGEEGRGEAGEERLGGQRPGALARALASRPGQWQREGQADQVGDRQRLVD